MSFLPFYTPEITLIDKTNDTVTPVTVEGNSSVANLNKFRISGKYR